MFVLIYPFTAYLKKYEFYINLTIIKINTIESSRNTGYKIEQFRINLTLYLKTKKKTQVINNSYFSESI